MRIPLHQIDAFTTEVFRGNPAAVCPLDHWLEDSVLQAIAAENNLAETAFLVPEGDGYRLRWFTPAVEVRLCGHATLASAHVIFHTLRPGAADVTFQSHSGPLRVTREGDLLTMDFPAWDASPCAPPDALVEGLRRAPAEVHRTRDLVAVYETEGAVRALRPDFERLREAEGLGIIATAPGESCDFVCRFFAPGAGIPEDPVTGSAQCTLAPFWSKRLGKSRLRSLQVSPRGGELFSEVRGDRVFISGRTVRYLEGFIYL